MSNEPKRHEPGDEEVRNRRLVVAVLIGLGLLGVVLFLASIYHAW